MYINPCYFTIQSLRHFVTLQLLSVFSHYFYLICCCLHELCDLFSLFSQFSHCYEIYLLQLKSSIFLTYRGHLVIRDSVKEGTALMAAWWLSMVNETQRPDRLPLHLTMWYCLNISLWERRVVNEITDSLEIDMYYRKLAFKFLGIFTA